MDSVNQIFGAIKSSPNPELYYFAAAIALILIFYLINKAIKLMIFCLMVIMLGLGFSLIQNGGDINALMTSINSSLGNIISSTQNSTSSATGSDKSSLQKAISDLISKFKGTTDSK